jgi:two-component system chemotaxis response regulator CheY
VSGKKQTILVVEDNEDMRAILHTLCSREGYKVITAKSGNEGVNLYREHKPDLVTMDLVMLDGGGFPAIKQIKEFDPEAKIIIITALGFEYEENIPKDTGTIAYLHKPYNKDELLDIIKKTLSGS